MRIAYLSQSYPPMISGASFAVQSLAENMAQCGHQVLVLTSSDLPEPYERRCENLTIIRYRSKKNPFRVGQRYSGWPHFQMMTDLRDFAPDIIHSHDPFQFAFTGLVYCQCAGIPSVFTTHQLPWFIKDYVPEIPGLRVAVEQIFWGYSRWLLRLFNKTISPTKTVSEVLFAKTGTLPDVIGYGIDLDCFAQRSIEHNQEIYLRTKFGIPRDVPVLLHVGRLDVDKHVRIVVQAAARAMAGNSAHLLVVGDGTEKQRLMQLCRKSGINGRSHFPGYVTSREELADIYRMSSVFITASEIETQGLVLLEAAACGLPIVAVDATCVSEIVRNGINGYLASPGDIRGLTAGIMKVIENKGKTKSLGQAGVLVSRKFGIERMVGHHEIAYLHAIYSSQKKQPLSKPNRVKSRKRQLFRD